MIFVWLLLKPLLSILSDIIRPIIIIGLLVFLDITLNLGFTDSIITMAESWFRGYFVDNLGGFL